MYRNNTHSMGEAIPMADDQIAEVAQAQELADSYLKSGANKLESVATIIGGTEAKKYGFTADNIIKVFAVVGAYNSWNFISKKGRENWKHVAIAAAAIVAIRTYTSSSTTTPEDTSKKLA